MANLTVNIDGTPFVLQEAITPENLPNIGLFPATTLGESTDLNSYTKDGAYMLLVHEGEFQNFPEDFANSAAAYFFLFVISFLDSAGARRAFQMLAKVTAYNDLSQIYYRTKDKNATGWRSWHRCLNEVDLAYADTIVAQANATVSMTANAVGADLEYQWQYSASGESWSNTTLAGNKTPTLTVTASAGRNGYRYRCLVSYGGDSHITKAYRLKVLSAPVSAAAYSLGGDVE